MRDRLVIRRGSIAAARQTIAVGAAVIVVAVLLVVLHVFGPAGAASGVPPYVRSSWFAGWPRVPDPDPADPPCLTVRDVVLRRDGRGVSFDPDDCRVVSGRWVDPYAGGRFASEVLVDVDHLVPLAHAHRSGGWRWPPAKRRAYAADLRYAYHLRAVSASENRRKGERGVDLWRPSNRGDWCTYAQAWATVKFVWNLSASEKERDAVAEMVATCAPDDAKGER